MSAQPRLTILFAAALFASACAGILGIRPPTRGPFEHRAHAAEGIHCLKCHSGVAAAGDTGPLHIPDDANCVSCHEKPHDTGTCTNCHGLASAREGAVAARENIHFDHGSHMTRTHGDCVRCHLDVERGSERLRPTMGTCLGCHNHNEEMVLKKCDGCHVDLPSERLRPEEGLVHGPDFMKEHGVRAAASTEICSGCHVQTFCTGCHAAGVAPALPARLAFDEPQRASVHRAGFLSRHAEEARGAPGLCTTCHSPKTCQSCHSQNDLTSAGALGGARNPHPAGWLGAPGTSNDHGRAAWRDPTECASCHGGAGEKLCVGCHKIGGVGGNPHAPGFTPPGDAASGPACRLCHGASQ